MNYNGTAIILSSVSGSGKSTLAAYLQTLNPNTVVCCADDFFTKDGIYSFDASKLYAAHCACQNKFRKALEEHKDIVVANTNTSLKERDFYIDKAKEAGYLTFSVVLENLGYTNVHSVPESTLEKQRNKLKSSIRL